jgi:DNA ligase-associated metallophosphoesterase
VVLSKIAPRAKAMQSLSPDIEFVLHGQTLKLMPERSINWVEQDALLTADLHLGKEGTFRSAGIPLPQGPSHETLARLSRAIERSGSSRLVVLGDLFHGEQAIQAMTDSFGRWRKQHDWLVMDLITGSHDRWSGDLPGEWGIQVHTSPLQIEPFALRHEPEPVVGAYVLAGHIHPGIGLRESRTGDMLRLPCFHFSQRIGLLPAFGEFTGLGLMEVEPGEACFAVAENIVVQVPG